MVQLRVFRPEHLETYEPGDLDRDSIGTVDLDAQAHRWTGNCVAAVEDGRTLGIAGMTKLDDGKVEAWLLGSDALRRRPVAMHRLVTRGLEIARRDLMLEAVYAQIRSDCAVARRWAERLGFQVIEDSGLYATYRKDFG